MAVKKKCQGPVDGIYSELLEHLPSWFLILWSVDEDGKVTPIVEPSIKPDVEKEKGFLVQQMERFSFDLALTHFKQALDTYKTSYPGSIALFRNSLQALIEEMVRPLGKEPRRVFTDTTKLLTKVGVLKESEKEEEVKAVIALFQMLSHYGSHPEYVTEETANFLYVWTISFISFLLNRYEKSTPAAEASEGKGGKVGIKNMQ